jgi:hypothetical protein
MKPWQLIPAKFVFRDKEILPPENPIFYPVFYPPHNQHEAAHERNSSHEERRQGSVFVFSAVTGMQNN